jgi:hypothetical protein
MKIQFDKSGKASTLDVLLNSFSKDEDINSILVLAGNNEEFEPQKIDPILRKSKKTVIGGIFSSIIYQKQVYLSGTIVIGLPFEISTHLVEDLSDKSQDLDAKVEEIAMNVDANNGGTFLVFADYYSTEVGAFIDSLFSIFGVINNFIGGGAGFYHPSDSMKSTHCIITNEGIKKDCAVLGFADTSSEICANHGWEKISKPYRVTSTEANRVKTIDWQPALDLYMKIVSEDSGKEMTEDNFFEIGKDYSLGIDRLGSNIIVREPIGIHEDRSMTFIVSIPNESYVYVLKGSTESMLKSVEDTTKEFYTQTSIDSEKFLFLIDCVSRYYYMGEDFEKEISLISHKDLPVVGVLSMGEIANTGQRFIEAYNKTFVIGVLDAKQR